MKLSLFWIRFLNKNSINIYLKWSSYCVKITVGRCVLWCNLLFTFVGGELSSTLRNTIRGHVSNISVFSGGKKKTLQPGSVVSPSTKYLEIHCKVMQASLSNLCLFAVFYDYFNFCMPECPCEWYCADIKKELWTKQCLCIWLIMCVCVHACVGVWVECMFVCLHMCALLHFCLCLDQCACRLFSCWLSQFGNTVYWPKMCYSYMDFSCNMNLKLIFFLFRIFSYMCLGLNLFQKIRQRG